MSRIGNIFHFITKRCDTGGEIELGDLLGNINLWTIVSNTKFTAIFLTNLIFSKNYSEIESLLYICDNLRSQNQKRCSHLCWIFFTNIFWYFLKLKIFFYGKLLESSDLIQSTIKVCRLDENKLIFKLDQILFLPDQWIEYRKYQKHGKHILICQTVKLTDRLP